MENSDEVKLERFLQWLEANGVELRGCKIKRCDAGKGFGIFLANDVSDDVLLVVPLDLAITPMRVLQDPLLGPECRAMFEEGEVDDRFLMNLFLVVERLRKNSSWRPYLDMLPTTFGNPLWFTDSELLELKGTTLYRATELQKKTLQSLYENKVKNLVKKLLSIDGDYTSEVRFEDFLWANSIFWARALNIPLPHSYVFPKTQDKERCLSVSENCEDHGSAEMQVSAETSATTEKETVWVEGLVPGIDFCNHDLKAAATWEVDGRGSITGVPYSMYLLSVTSSSGWKAEPLSSQIDREISISYGNKGNEELLYLYGFVIENNPDDYLMVHYPVEAMEGMPFSDSKTQLLLAQNAEMRCLLPRRLLDHGLFPLNPTKDKGKEERRTSTYSWSGERQMPSYSEKLVFPENFVATLRTIAMKEDELFQVSTLLEELVGTEKERQPNDAEVRAAVWEACGDSGALQLLVDLLQMKLMDLEEGTGTMDNDTELLKDAQIIESQDQLQTYKKISGGEEDGLTQQKCMSRNRWSSIVYRRGQKELTSLFLREAEQALQLSLCEGN